MNSIGLINPWYNYESSEETLISRVWPPLSLANCATLLEKNGFDVEIIDANATKLTPKQVAKKSKEFDKIFITSSSIDRWQCPHLDLDPFLKYIKVLKNKELYVMGSHGTIRPKEMLNITKAKAIIIGEPELTVLEICKSKNIEKISGICYKRNKKVIVKPRKKYLDLDSLPKPAFHLLPMEKYFYEILGDKFTLFETSRGCPYECIFCLKKMYGNAYRKKSAKKVIEELKETIENYKIKTAYFIDLEFTLNRKLVEELCNFLIKEKYDFKWCCQTRADSVDSKLLRIMKKAGCELIHYGVETGSERIMKLLNKNITLEKIERTIKLTKKVGIKTACFFMFGFPTETFGDMKLTIDFAKKLDPTYVSFHVAIPYPNTPFYNIIKEETKELFPQFNPQHSYENLKKITRNAYFQFYFRPSIFSRINKNPSVLIKQLKLFFNYIR